MMSINEQEISEKPQNNDSEVVLSVNGVSKRFCRDLKKSLFYGVQDIASEVLGLREKGDKLRPKEFWALDNVSFQLRRGEALGLVGKNGSGKSTLLRVIAGLIKPDTGFVEVNGRIAPLIALGAGFNPILTGRENIYANMSILGLSKKEIDERFDEVVEFAEIGDAIDSPVQTYSSGMAARLGFASAIHTDPEILLVDEVLAVGDANFKAKCFRKLQKLRENKTSFILVNHNPQAILSACDSAVYLSKGKLIINDKTLAVIQKYEEDLFQSSITQKSIVSMFLPQKLESETFGINITSLFFRNKEGNMIDSLVTGECINFCVGCKAYKRFEKINLHLTITELGGEAGIVLFLSGANDQHFFEMLPGEHEIQVQMPYLSLKSGTYSMTIKLKRELYTFETIENFIFSVKSDSTMSNCMFYQPRKWQIISST